MALTLVEGNKYSTTKLQAVVVDLLVKESKIMEHLPFETILGNSLTYNKITTDAGASFYDVGDTWIESTMVLTQATATLKIMGGDADLDNFLLKTRSNITDMKTQVVDNKIKAVKNKFLDTFFYGNATTDPKTFDGLQVLIADAGTYYNTVHAGSGTGTALSVAKLRQAIDYITGFTADYIVMTKAMRRGLSVYLDSIGDKFPTGRDKWGQPAMMWDSIPIIVDDNLLDTETAGSGAYSAKTGGANTTIFILSFDNMSVCGIHSGDMIQVENLGALETKDATRIRIKWYVGLKFENLRSSAKVDGIVSAGAVTA